MTVEKVISVVFLCVMSMVVIGFAIAWHRDRDNNFDLRHAFVDGVTGRISAEKTAFMVVLCLMSWGFVDLVLGGKLTEWYAGLFGTIFAAARLGAQGLSVWKETSSQQPPKPPGPV